MTDLATAGPASSDGLAREPAGAPGGLEVVAADEAVEAEDLAAEMQAGVAEALHGVGAAPRGGGAPPAGRPPPGGALGLGEPERAGDRQPQPLRRGDRPPPLVAR